MMGWIRQEERGDEGGGRWDKEEGEGRGDGQINERREEMVVVGDEIGGGVDASGWMR